jgi:hypothetical protein
MQYDHVRGEFPVQHPGPFVGAGGVVSVGGSVNSHSSGSSVSIHEHTPADSHSSPVAKSLQNEKVLGEYPVQHPSSYTGAGVLGDGVGSVITTGDPVGHGVIVGGVGVGASVGSGVGGVHSGESGSPTIHEHSAALIHTISTSMLPQYDHVRGELPAQHPSPEGVGAGGNV